MLKKNIIISLSLLFSLYSFGQLNCTIDKINLTSSLLGFWNFNGNAIDYSGNGKHGNIVEATFCKDRFGNTNSALKFDGQNDHVFVSNILNLKSSYTISGWYKSDTLQGGSFVYIGVNGAPGCDGVGVGQGNNGTWFSDGNYLVAGGCNGLNWMGTDYELPPTGTWNHFALVKDVNKMIIYINGKSAHYFMVGDALFQSNNIYFGAAAPGGDYAFKGELDDIYFYDRSLSAEEIKQLYFTHNGITLELLHDDKKIIEKGKDITISTKDIYDNYQWFLNDKPILNAVSRELIVNAPGNYSVNVTNKSCESKSPIISFIETDKTPNCNFPSSILKTDLIGYYPFCGNANDLSGNNNHGIVSGAKLAQDRFGNINSAYYFNGNQDFILMEKAMKNYNTLTISGWYNSAAIQGASFVYCGINSPNLGCNGFGVGQGQGDWINEGNNLHCASSCSGGWRSAEYELPSINTWNHFSLTKNNEEYGVYINGKLIRKFSAPHETEISNLIFIGAASSLGDYSFQGFLDDIAIYNRALSEQEITNLYTSCSHEQASSDAHNSILFATGNPIELAANPAGGFFTSVAIKDGKFDPTTAKIGLNKIQYNFKNSQGCNDSTLFTMIVADTVGMTCKKYDTITVTNSVTKYDTVIVKTNVFDTVKVNTYDTITVKNNVYDTVIINKTKYDTITITNSVTKYDTLKVTKYDTITVTNNITKYDTVIVPKTVTKYDTVKVNTYDTITVTNNVTKYDTVIVNKTKYDTITITDTVNILKINFKLTTGLQANQLASMSVYPNPTTDVLHIEIGDVKALEGYRYRILDALGKEVYNQLVKNTLTEIPLKTIGTAGMYQLEVLDANKTSIQTNKIVLQ